jgi:hypothetical protein
MTHLGTENIRYGQKKGQEFQPLKVKSRPDFYLSAGGVPQIVGKLSTRATTLL